MTNKTFVYIIYLLEPKHEILTMASIIQVKPWYGDTLTNCNTKDPSNVDQTIIDPPPINHTQYPSNFNADWTLYKN